MYFSQLGRLEAQNQGACMIRWGSPSESQTSLCNLTWQKGLATSLGLFCKNTSPAHRGSTLMTSPPPNTITCRHEVFNTWIWGGTHKHSACHRTHPNKWQMRSYTRWSQSTKQTHFWMHNFALELVCWPKINTQGTHLDLVHRREKNWTLQRYMTHSLSQILWREDDDLEILKNSPDLLPLLFLKAQWNKIEIFSKVWKQYWNKKSGYF